MWNCLNCYNENANTAAFCVYCGAGRIDQTQASALKPMVTATRGSALTANRHFPLNVPVVLRLSEGSTRAIAGVFGIIAGISTSFLIFMLAEPEGMTGRLFNLMQPFAAVPVLILIMFCWGLAICLLRYLRISSWTSVSTQSLLHDAMDVGKLDGLEQLADALDSPVVQCSPLLKRIQAVTTQWSISPNLQDADILLQQHLYSDEEDTRAGYVLLRTFIWALPVLGLLGTVAGVAVAVGGFAQFLGGDIEDVAVIKRSLVAVTAGLSYAFLTTLYGLAAALILMLLTTALQTREEKLFTSVQQRITNLFLPFLQRLAPERKGADVASIAGLEEKLMKISASVLDYVREQGKLTLQSFSDQRNHLQENVTQWGRLLREEATAGAENISQALDRVGIRMSNAQFEFVQKFESLKSEMDGKAAAVLQSTAILSESLVDRQQSILAGISEQNATVQKNSDVFSDLAKLSHQALQLNAEMNNALKTLGELKLEDRARDIIRVMEIHKQEIEASVLAVSQNSGTTTEVLAAQSRLHDSISKLHEMRLDETLREFRDSLTDLKPVLENLREPFILQAVPVAKERMNS
jgi:biopolymer transport protein ExbB/TolQ